MSSVSVTAATGADPAGIFDGGGRMGELMRSIDWSSTPVGPVEQWPQSLKTALSILLKQRTATFLFWGPEHVQFYNDAYRPILGSKKHPAAMGQRGAECWPEIWDIILPMLEAVHRGESTAVEDGLLVIDRNGYLEEGYYTYTYSPIAVESGTVGGCFCVVYDTTARVIGERRLRTLRDLASRTITKDAEEACDRAAATLAENSFDVPFAALYLFDDARRSARLAGAAGVEAGSAAAPRTISFEGDISLVAKVAGLGRTTEIPELDRSLGPLPGGPWPIGASSGILLPIMIPGQALPTGFLLAGVNPRKRLDADYSTFFELIAGQIGTAVAEARAYEEERKRAEGLAELDRAKTAFFSNVSHEFRTPLTLMLAPLTDIIAGPEGPIEKYRGELTIVHRNCLRLLRLVNTLLDFTRIEAGRVQAKYAPIDLALLTSDLASVFRSAIEKAGLQLVVDCSPLAAPVFADREMWEKIVLNLLSNAFKYTFEGEIRVSVKEANGKAELCVADTGVGIAASELPHIFERFRRVEGTRARSQEGSGIGLALVQELVKLHGGTVRAESVPGEGSRFVVSLPFGSEHLPKERINVPDAQVSTALGAQPFIEEALRWLPDMPASLADLPDSDQASDLGEPASPASARVLIADDNADMREYLRRLLGHRYEIVSAPDGRRALEIIRREPPDLVLTDVMMPEVDGFRLLRAIRQDPELSSLPVVLLSARAGEESRVEGLRAGADDYIVKPFSARELLVRISSLLEISRLRKSSAEAERRLLAEAEAERKKLRGLIEQGPAMMAVLAGPDHVFQIVNREYAKGTGRNEADLLNKPLREALPEIASQIFLELLDSVYRTGEPFVGKEMLARLDRRGDGSLEDRYFNFVYQVWTDAAGQTQGIFVHAVDVSEHVSARQRIEENERALRMLVEREREARKTAELLNRVGPTLLGELDFRPLVQSVTNIARELVGAEVAAFFRNGIAEEPWAVSGEPSEAFSDLPQSAWSDLFAEPNSGKGCVCRVDIRIPADGSTRGDVTGPATGIRSVLGARIADRSGQPLGTLAFGHSAPGKFTPTDEAVVAGIAAQAAIAMDNARLFEEGQWIQIELKRSNEELRRANRDLETFAYSASHDLQEPLRTIAISSELLDLHCGQDLDAEGSMFLSNIGTAARRMTTLIEDLLAYTRATKSEEGPAPSVDAGRVFGGVVETLKGAIQESGAVVSAGNLATVCIHERALGQIFQNLIGNAIKYRGAEPPRIDVSSKENDGWCVFSVADNGIGIEPEFRDRVFGLFKRLHNREQYPGSGVGLAICQRLVEQYGGRIWIEDSTAGQGCVFCFSVPMGPSEVAQAKGAVN